MSKKILITGGAGFIGSNFIIYFLDKYVDYEIINLDKLTYAADLNNLKSVQDNSRYTFIKGCVTDQDLIDKIFKQHDIDGIIHFAAESHVDNSIKWPRAFIDSNIIGTFNLLEVARKYWMTGPSILKSGKEHCRFHHISTDEVYGGANEGLFTEITPYAPNSPYSASKASSNFLARSYFKTFGLNVTISNCSNNFGPRQHQEKLIPLVINRAINGKPIPIYGKGINIRDWIYVLDHCQAIDLIFHKGIPGECYNIGGHNEKTNLEIVETICNLLDKKVPKLKHYTDQIEFVVDRPGHDLRYATNTSKIETTLNWRALESFTSGIEKTVDWYLQYYQTNN